MITPTSSPFVTPTPSPIKTPAPTRSSTPIQTVSPTPPPPKATFDSLEIIAGVITVVVIALVALFYHRKRIRDRKIC
jgi:hypothetical protein